MWCRYRIAIWALVAVAAVSTLVVSSCGSTTTSQETKHYSNATYNFAFDYGPPFENIPFSEKPAGQEFGFGVAQKTSQADFDKGVGNWLLIGVMTGPGSVDPRFFGLDWLRSKAKIAQAFDSFTLLASRQTTLGQQPAFLYEGTGAKAGRLLHFKNVLIVTPQYAYQLVAQAAVDVWDGTVGQQMQQSLSSFRLLQTPPAVAASATAAPVSTTLYRNSQFRFSLRYPASFSKLDKDALPNAKTIAADFAVGFLDTGAAAQAAQSGTLHGVEIQVMRLPRKLTPAQAEYFLRSARAAQEKQTTAQYQSAYPGAEVSPIRMGRFNGTPCYVFDVNYPYGDNRLHDKIYYIMVGAFTYQIQLASPQADWNANRTTLERVAQTFRTF